jgi:GNAT superfamily N-acetyltransferase
MWNSLIRQVAKISAILRRPPSSLVICHGRDIHDLDAYAEMLIHVDSVMDQPAYGHISSYHEVEIPRGLPLEWIAVNADIYTFLIDRFSDRATAYLNAIPVTDAAYAAIRSGNKDDNYVSAGDVTPYVGRETVRIYLMSIAVADEYRSLGSGMLQTAYVRLVRGFINKLIWYAEKHGVRATHLLATAWTPEGRRVCEYFAMTPVGKDRYGDVIFELDVERLRLAAGRDAPSRVMRLLAIYDRLSSG